MASTVSFLIFSGSKKKEPRYVCLKTKPPYSHKMWTEFSSSIPHFLQVGLLLSPITQTCLLKLLCPVRRTITILDCVLLQENNRDLVSRLGPEISSRTCLCVLQGPRHNTKCSFFHPAFYPSSYVLPRDPPKKTQLQQTFEQNRLLRACRPFHFLVSLHVQGSKLALT